MVRPMSAWSVAIRRSATVSTHAPANLPTALVARWGRRLRKLVESEPSPMLHRKRGLEHDSQMNQKRGTSSLRGFRKAKRCRTSTRREAHDGNRRQTGAGSAGLERFQGPVARLEPSSHLLARRGPRRCPKSRFLILYCS